MKLYGNLTEAATIQLRASTSGNVSTIQANANGLTATFTLPAVASDTFEMLAAAQTPTNKTFDSTSTATGIKLASFTPDGTHTLTAPTVTDTLVGLAASQALTNKTLGSTNTATGINMASWTPDGGTHTLTAPAVTDTLVALAASQTLTNKTLTAPVISTISNTGTLTLPTSTDTLVGRATTDTLTNKTISGASNTLTVRLNTADVTGTLGASNGGTGVTSVTTAPTASAFAGWDANKNLSTNSLLEGYATTATAAGTTTLTVSSAQQQYFTGSTTQTVQMPVTSTLVLGQSWTIVNLSTGNVTVQSSGGNTIATLGQNSQAVVTCILTSGTTAASWNSITSTATAGTVTSVAMTVPGILSVSGSPVTTTGTLALSLATQSANTVFAGPSSGGAVAPTFRSLVSADLPAAGTSQGAISYEVTTASKTGNWVANHSNNASTNITVVMTRVSDVVTLTIPVPATLANTDGTDNFMTFSQVLDNAYIPSTIRRFCSGQSFNNGVNVATPAMLEVNTSGHLILYRDGAVTAWTSGVSGSGLAAAMSVTYKL